MLYFEEQPLDLSTKGSHNNNNEVKDIASLKNFNIEQFYRTYHAISVRSWNTYQAQQYLYNFTGPNYLPTMTTASSSTVKRKLSDEFDELAASKKIKVGAGDNKNISNNKMTRRKRREELSLIQQSCDCRECYENHINKLRNKTDLHEPNSCAHFNLKC